MCTWSCCGTSSSNSMGLPASITSRSLALNCSAVAGGNRSKSVFPATSASVDGEEGGEPAVDHQVAAGRVLHIDDRRRVLQDRLEPRLALAERLLTLLRERGILLGTPLAPRWSASSSHVIRTPPTVKSPTPTIILTGSAAPSRATRTAFIAPISVISPVLKQSGTQASKPGAEQDGEKQDHAQARPWPRDPQGRQGRDDDQHGHAVAKQRVPGDLRHHPLRRHRDVSTSIPEA